MKDYQPKALFNIPMNKIYGLQRLIGIKLLLPKYKGTPFDTLVILIKIDL